MKSIDVEGYTVYIPGIATPTSRIIEREIKKMISAIEKRKRRGRPKYVLADNLIKSTGNWYALVKEAEVKEENGKIEIRVKKPKLDEITLEKVRDYLAWGFEGKFNLSISEQEYMSYFENRINRKYVGRDGKEKVRKASRRELLDIYKEEERVIRSIFSDPTTRARMIERVSRRIAEEYVDRALWIAREKHIKRYKPKTILKFLRAALEEMESAKVNGVLAGEIYRESIRKVMKGYELLEESKREEILKGISEIILERKKREVADILAEFAQDYIEEKVEEVLDKSAEIDEIMNGDFGIVKALELDVKIEALRRFVSSYALLLPSDTILKLVDLYRQVSRTGRSRLVSKMDEVLYEFAKERKSAYILGKDGVTEISADSIELDGGKVKFKGLILKEGVTAVIPYRFPDGKTEKSFVYIDPRGYIR